MAEKNLETTMGRAITEKQRRRRKRRKRRRKRREKEKEKEEEKKKKKKKRPIIQRNGSRLDQQLKLDEEDPEQDDHLTARERLWRLMDDPGSGTAARWVSITVMLLIFISCVSFAMETMPSMKGSQQNDVFFVIEAVCSVLFSIEYLLRICSCPALCPFLLNALNIIDLIAVVPFWIQLGLGAKGSGSQVLRVIRLVRVVRVFRFLGM